MAHEISLDGLTQQHVNECAPNIGKCSYAAPCIIGTLFDGIPENYDGLSIEVLVEDGLVSMPASQLQEAVALQEAFDCNDQSRLSMLLAVRGLEWPQ